MDTGTHFVMGIAIGGLATLDPAIGEHTLAAQAVLIGAVLGQQAPDLDTVLKLKNNAVYIRNHRGITHSIPAVMFWPLLISGTLGVVFPEVNFLHLWLWTFFAVMFHVFVDIFNAYGTQAIRPISSKWVALGIINTFDPFIFGAHVAGIILWGFGLHPGIIFFTMYMVIAVYYVFRFIEQRRVKNSILKLIPDAKKVIISPTMRFHRWRIAALTDTKYYVARSCDREVTILDTFDRVPLPHSSLLEAAKHDKNLSAFLSFSPIYRFEITEGEELSEVRFIDLRYRTNGYYPFVAVVHLDKELNIVNSYTGWIFSEEKLRKKLQIVPG
ncbi:metal-dependent hydrolase [Peribacillus kribbensis]|uniref:metal-dependent hydrolase n=1 Tax=Peribacillus kribbensis TaxID=356658 RepID=UPI000427B0B3|nr:metal-dependent hydrolase [Peribacillus kribbensis]